MTIKFKKNEPFVEGVSLLKITSKVETPFYIYSQKTIKDAYDKVKKNINAEIFYAIKANSNLAIISILKNLGFFITKFFLDNSFKDLTKLEFFVL